jgi:hypothetical protein
MTAAVRVQALKLENLIEHSYLTACQADSESGALIRWNQATRIKSSHWRKVLLMLLLVVQLMEE